MELRVIDGQNFIVQQNGKLILTPAETKAAIQGEIEAYRARIGQLDTTVGKVRQRLESELIEGLDTAATRAELADLGEEIHSLQRDIDAANRRINQVDQLIDQHAAASILQADQAKLEALTAPFDSILKELA